jgi:FkbM family methyltransferase
MRIPGLNAVRAIWRRLPTFGFSQYGEDALLVPLMALRQGFYVDVGAGHPSRGSNTYRLYLKGWRGLAIEPNAALTEPFRRVRPHDTVLTMGVAEQSADLVYHRLEDSRFNSFRPSEHHLTLPRDGEPESVPCRPLRDIVAEHAQTNEIDLLSVDCEGLDYEALATLDWSKTRPSVVIVEDYEQFSRVAKADGSAIAKFMRARGYACFGQAMLSYLFVDLHAIGKPRFRTAGFDYQNSQVGALLSEYAQNVAALEPA